jgi:hypothetical protein
MARHLSKQTWETIRTRFDLGDPLLQIANDLDISEGTIRHRIKRDNWVPKLRTQVTDIKEKIADITKNIANSQIPMVQHRLDQITNLSLHQKINNYIERGVDLNHRNIEEIAREPDLEKRVNLTAKAKCTMADLATIGNIKPNLEPEKEEEKNESRIRFYLPIKDKK